MDSLFNGKSFFNQKDLLIDHNIINFQYNSDNNLSCKYEINEKEKKLHDLIFGKENFEIKPYYGQKERYDFLLSKLKAMEKMDLDDECCVEGEVQIRKINIDKNIFPKSNRSKDNKGSISSKKGNCKKNAKKKSGKKNKKNILTNEKFKIGRSNNMKVIGLFDEANLYINKGVQKNTNFFSNKSLLKSIIDEIDGK